MDEICKMYAEQHISIRNIAKLTHRGYYKIRNHLIQAGLDLDNPEKTFGPPKKPKGYWGIKENNEREAAKYEKSSDFYRYSSSAAHYAAKNGWMDEYYKKYFKKETRYSSFADKVHLIYSYEFPKQKMVYVGRTNNLHRRDYSHRTATFGDSLTAFAYSLQLEIPTPIIKDKDLTAEESQIKENYWGNWYQTNGWTLINKGKMGKNSSSLGAIPRKWTYETCKELALTCKNKQEFKLKSSRAHNVSRENKWIDDFFPEPWRQPNGTFDNIENCKKECEKRGYKKLTDIKKFYPFLYHKICDHKWNDEFRFFFNNNKYQHYIKKKK